MVRSQHPGGGLPAAGTAGAEAILTIKELRTKIIDRAAVDREFRASLVGDPKRAIERELGIPIPASYSIDVHEDSRTTAHVVLPPASSLSETDLETVIIGGWSVNGERVTVKPGRARGFLEWLEDLIRSW